MYDHWRIYEERSAIVRESKLIIQRQEDIEEKLEKLANYERLERQSKIVYIPEPFEDDDEDFSDLDEYISEKNTPREKLSNENREKLRPIPKPRYSIRRISNPPTKTPIISTTSRNKIESITKNWEETVFQKEENDNTIESDYSMPL
jgi:hypothetical protein